MAATTLLCSKYDHSTIGSITGELSSIADIPMVPPATPPALVFSALATISITDAKAFNHQPAFAISDPRVIAFAGLPSIRRPWIRDPVAINGHGIAVWSNAQSAYFVAGDSPNVRIFKVDLSTKTERHSEFQYPWCPPQRASHACRL